MSNSVITVRENPIEESLLLVIGQDGVISPNKETVQEYLNTRNETELRIMKVNKCDGRMIDVTVDHMTYIASQNEEVIYKKTKEELEFIARSLINFRLDHDYTPFVHSPTAEFPEIDELDQTLSLLEGGPGLDTNQPPALVPITEPKPAPSKAETPLENPPTLIPAQTVDKLPQLKKNQETNGPKTPEPVVPEPAQPESAPKPEETKSTDVPAEKTPEKKPQIQLPQTVKKKIVRKPLPNDFVLFSTPDIIRRVGSATPGTPPANVTELPMESGVKKEENFCKKGVEASVKTDKGRRISSERKVKGDENIPSAKDIRSIIQSENTKTYTSNLVIPESSTSANKPEEEEDLGLTIDSIDELLYKVAETLAGDKEFQNALDKSLDENMELNSNVSSNISSNFDQSSSQETPQSANQTTVKGTQVVRPGGRIVVIPPLERPATRSRDKVQTTAHESAAKVVKPAKATVDEEPQQVSGGELESEDEDEKSDDDPDKLWCICNQPHNNRFMICCDSCEEWYHGKCVNVTKQMGQMMEKEGKEWICLYCKDSTLQRPPAAARRIRRASKNSANETAPTPPEPVGHQIVPVATTVASVANVKRVQGCLVCGKPCRNHSIFCSDACIVQNSRNVEKVLVFERATGRLLSGNDAPTVANLDNWLKEHPGFEVVKSRMNASKPAVIQTAPKIQTKLQIVKDPLHRGVSLALHKRGIPVGMLKHALGQKIEQNELAQLKKQAQINKLQQQIRPKVIPKVLIEPKVVKTPLQIRLTSPIPMLPNQQPVAGFTVKRKLLQRSTIIETPQIIKPKLKVVKKPIELSAEKKQENIRDNVRKSLSEQLINRLQAQNEIKLDKDSVTKITTEIESQLFKCFADTGQKYRNKYRSLMFNIKDVKNQTLWRSICQKTVNPYQLVRLSSDDLASQELALWRERENKHQLDIITKNELDQIGRSQQFVIKTHKGEQELEDNRLATVIDKIEMVTGSAADENAASISSDAEMSDKRPRDNRRRNRRSSRDRSRRRRTSRDRKKRSRSRSKTRSDRDDRRRRSSHKSSRRKPSPDKLDKKSKEILDNLVDNKIVPPLEDKLWKHVVQEDITTAPAESDSDHEPSSTVTISTPPPPEEQPTPVVPPAKTKEEPVKPVEHPDNEGGHSPLPSKQREAIWGGNLSMVDVAELTITAHEVSGDCNGLGDELPALLDVVGRISPDTVWDYIGKMKSSNSKAIALLRLNATTVEAQMPYIALYSYLQSRNRLGVVKSCGKGVKDFYILPLASHMPIPQVLLPLSGPSFEESRPVLLLGIIIRDKRKRPLFAGAVSSSKRLKTMEKLSTVPVRSYTPPPAINLQYKATPLCKPSPKTPEEDMDEPYSPKDSDPDTGFNNSEEEVKTTVSPSKSFLEVGFIEPFSNKFDGIPGLESSNITEKHQLQREMEVLDRQIAKQKAEIQNMSQNIASTSATHVGASLSEIELPRNIQQILDSIKAPAQTSSSVAPQATDMTIPLMLPKRNLQRSSGFCGRNSPPDYGGGGMLSGLTDEELIRKANEMMEGD